MTVTEVKSALHSLVNGHPVIVIEDADYTSEANLVVGALIASAEQINHFAMHGRQPQPPEL